jgi:hypothetical protein
MEAHMGRGLLLWLIGIPLPIILLAVRRSSSTAAALRRAMLPERRAGATLGDMQLRSHLLNAGTATRGA